MFCLKEFVVTKKHGEILKIELHLFYGGFHWTGVALSLLLCCVFVATNSFSFSVLCDFLVPQHVGLKQGMMQTRNFFFSPEGKQVSFRKVDDSLWQPNIEICLLLSSYLSISLISSGLVSNIVFFFIIAIKLSAGQRSTKDKDYISQSPLHLDVA